MQQQPIETAQRLSTAYGVRHLLFRSASTDDRHQPTTTVGVRHLRFGSASTDARHLRTTTVVYASSHLPTTTVDQVHHSRPSTSSQRPRDLGTSDLGPQSSHPTTNITRRRLYVSRLRQQFNVVQTRTSADTSSPPRRRQRQHFNFCPPLSAVSVTRTETLTAIIVVLYKC